jgi:hypothetical protein
VRKQEQKRAENNAYSFSRLQVADYLEIESVYLNAIMDDEKYCYLLYSLVFCIKGNIHFMRKS